VVSRKGGTPVFKNPLEMPLGKMKSGVLRHDKRGKAVAVTWIRNVGFDPVDAVPLDRSLVRSRSDARRPARYEGKGAQNGVPVRAVWE